MIFFILPIIRCFPLRGNEKQGGFAVLLACFLSYFCFLKINLKFNTEI